MGFPQLFCESTVYITRQDLGVCLDSGVEAEKGKQRGGIVPFNFRLSGNFLLVIEFSHRSRNFVAANFLHYIEGILGRIAILSFRVFLCRKFTAVS